MTCILQVYETARRAEVCRRQMPECLTDPRLCGLPGLSKRPQLDIERPRAAILVNDMPYLACDRFRLDEKVIRPVGVAFPCPRQIDYGVDNDVRDVHAL